MAGLAARGFTGVLHTFSENDFAYYRDTMRQIVEASHDVGLTAQASPWGLGRTFGGEAESRWVTFHPEECQVLDDGRRVAGACLNSPAYRAFCKEWADWVLDCGVDSVFWDEPAWMVPEHVGIDDPSRWTCRCSHCAERFGGPVPGELTPEVQAFREASVVDFLREVVAHVAARGGANTICLLPSTGGLLGISDWNLVAELPGLTTFATDPYWKHWNEPAGPFVRRFARLLRETCEQHGVGSQLWLPIFGLTKEEIPELEAAIAAARDEGVEDLWTWGYEACGFMTHLATPDSPLVWEAVSAALTGSPAVETRSTRELVNLLNVEDATVSAAVARAGDALAAAIEAIAARIAAGGRLVYAGAGTSGRLAALDAAEVGPTFGSPPGEVAAIVAGEGEDAEDDAERGGEDVRRLAVGPQDAVVAVSASGSTPYTLAALETARSAGALCVAVVCAADSPIAAIAEHEVAVLVGPEVVSGSTRLKAGTAQKLVLNSISTAAMIRLGRTYDGLMVGVVPENAKLRERARRNVVIATGRSEADVDDALAVADGVIVDVGLAGGTRGRIAVPGFVDLQVNGYGGVDFLSASTLDYETAGAALLEGGVTAYQPTFITAPESATLDALRAMPANGSFPRVVGAHVERPFISPEPLGTHPLEHRRDPDLDLLDRLLDAGRVTEFTLAPELPGADELIRRLLERGVVVSAGHTNATAAQAHAAFDLGVSTVSHLFNAMRPFRSRDPGIVGVALTRRDVYVQIIVDGHHLAEETVRLVWAAAGGRCALVSDATAGAAGVTGPYQLGDIEIDISDGVPVRGDGVLAGTVLTMIEAVRNLHALGIPFEDAIGAATSVPARILGRADLGVLEPGGLADVVVLDDRLEIVRVVCGGEARVVA